MPPPVMCAFCGQEAEGGEVDPCALIVVSRWREPEARQREQQFFTHAHCLQDRLHPDAAAVARVLDLDWDGEDI